MRQPWAWLVVHGQKDIENRDWPLPKTFTLPQRIYVHAGAKPDGDNYNEIKWALIAAQRLAGEKFYAPLWKLIYHRKKEYASYYGAIVGEVTITGCVSHSTSKWFSGAYGFLLADPIAYAQPIPCKGRMGFWELPDAVVEQIRAVSMRQAAHSNN